MAIFATGATMGEPSSPTWPLDSISNSLASAIYEASAIVARTGQLDSVLESIILAVRHHLGFDRAGIWLYDPQAGGLRGKLGTDRELNLRSEEHLFIPASRVGEPAMRVIHREVPYFLTQDLEAEVPEEHRRGMDGVRANAIVPLECGGDLIGVLSVDNVATGRTIPESLLPTLMVFANLAATAIGNTLARERDRLLMAEMATRERLERRLRELEIVHRIAGAITSLDLASVLREIRDGLVDGLGFDRAGILLVDPRDPHVLTGTWGTDLDGNVTDEREMRMVWRETPHLAAIMGGDVPYWIRPLGQSPEPAEGQLLKQHVLVPLRSGAQTVGVLSVDNVRSQRPITETDAEVVLILAGHAAVAIEKARLFSLEHRINRRLEQLVDRERHIASTLQKCFVPRIPRRLHEARLVHLYKPASAEADVGGDFYDVLDFGEGCMGLVLADVTGKGLAAAVETAYTKYALRAYAFDDPSPARVITRVNRLLCRQDPFSRLVTMFYGVLDTRASRLTYVLAGHEPPIFVPRDGAPIMMEEYGAALGIIEDLEYQEFTRPFNPGDALLLYSDGVSEARRGGDFFGYESLRELVAEHSSANPYALLQEIHLAVTAFSGGQVKDDVALLWLCRDDPNMLPE